MLTNRVLSSSTTIFWKTGTGGCINYLVLTSFEFLSTAIWRMPDSRRHFSSMASWMRTCQSSSHSLKKKCTTIYQITSKVFGKLDSNLIVQGLRRLTYQHRTYSVSLDMVLDCTLGSSYQILCFLQKLQSITALHWYNDPFAFPDFIPLKSSLCSLHIVKYEHRNLWTI